MDTSLFVAIGSLCFSAYGAYMLFKTEQRRKESERVDLSCTLTVGSSLGQWTVAIKNNSSTRTEYVEDIQGRRWKSGNWRSLLQGRVGVDRESALKIDPGQVIYETVIIERLEIDNIQVKLTSGRLESVSLPDYWGVNS